MFKRSCALVLGLLVSSSATFAQCRNVSPAQYGYQQNYGGVASGAYYDARTGGRYVNPGVNYGGYSNPLAQNNVRVYQDQLNQAYQVNAGNGAYNNGYAYGYSNG